MSVTTEFKPEFGGAGATMFGTFYPRNDIVAVIHDAGKAEKAAEALRADGFAADAVMVATGEQVPANHHAYLEQHGLRRRLGRLVPGQKSEVLEEYLAEAANGVNVLTVRVLEAGPGADDGDPPNQRGYAMRDDGGHSFTDR